MYARRHLYSTTWIWYDSSFQRLLFPDLAIIAALSIGLSTITLQPDFFPGLTLTGSEFLNNLEGIENGFKGLTTKVGTLVALLLGYRVNNTYDRYCSARKMWCELENTSRDLARNVCMFIPTTTTTAATAISHNDTRTTSQGRTTTSSSSSSRNINSNSNKVLLIQNKQLMLNLIRLYPIALHFFLTTKGSHHKLSRKGPDFPEQIFNEFHAECIDMWKQYDDGNAAASKDLDKLLVRIFDAFKNGKHVPLLILNMMGKCLADLSSLRSASSNISIIDSENIDNTNQIICNVINPIYIREMDHQIQRLSGGPFERILRTPMPTGFTRYASRVTTIWAYTVPFGLITDLGPYFNPVGSLFVVYCVMAIDDIGIQLEEPFNILPQRQYSDGIVDAVNLIETTFDD
jgi:predicted membrane chloride channel (bestrophin family)